MSDDDGEEFPLDDEADDGAMRQSPLRSVELEDALGRRTPRSLRAVYVAGTTIILALALIPLWQNLAALRQASSAQDNQRVAVEIASNITTGTVTLNGKSAGTHLPLLLNLQQGQNVITLDAPPFRRHICRITMPDGATGDTCRGLSSLSPLNSEQRLYRVSQHQLVSAYVVAFLVGLPDLPTDQQASALTAISDSLSSELDAMAVPVPPGNHFATALAENGSTAVSRAAQTLTATPGATLSRLAGAFSCAVSACPYIAETTLSDRPTETRDPQWTAWVGATLGWRFTDSTGAEVGNVLFRAGLVGPTLAVTLAYSATSGWYAPQSAALSDQLRGEVALALCLDGASDFSTSEIDPWGRIMLISGESGASLNGCTLSIRLLAGEAQGATVSVLWRFGTFLAADDAAARVFLDLPLASPDELAAARA